MMEKSDDVKYMKLAINLAKRGIGTTSPNPAVGSLIVKDGKVLGRGFHKVAGENHAEINALISASYSAEGSTMYVTLEPCCHYGKTPPCTNAIKKSGIKRVVIGMIDPNPLVCGKGIKELKKAGIEIEVGVLKDEVRKLNEAYTKYITTGIPFIIIKYAMTFDGKIASRTGDSKWISSADSRDFVQKLRSSVDAILVGINTVIKDNPKLTVRSGRGHHPKEGTRKNGTVPFSPIRIILDSYCRTPLSSNVLDSSAKTIIVTTNFASKTRIGKIQKNKAEVLVVDSKNKRVNIKDLFYKLAKRNITSVLIEGGSEVNADVINSGLADKIYIFFCPLILGGKKAITAVEGKGIKFVKDAIKIKDIEIKKIGSDFLLTGYVYRNN